MSSKPSMWQIVKSVLGAFMGVQSDETRSRDFKQTNPWVYVLVGFIVTVAFVGTLIVVSRVLVGSTQ